MNHPQSNIPSLPRWISFVSSILMVKNPIPQFDKIMKKIGPSYYFYIGGAKKGLITSDWVLIKHFLQKNNKNYIKSAFQRDVLKYYIGNGLLTNEGADWLRQRRLIQPAFHKDRINALAELMASEVDLVCDRMIRDHTPTPINDLSTTLAFQIIARAMFSDDVDMRQITAIRDRVERVQQMTINQIRQPFKKNYYRWTGQIKLHKRLAKETLELIALIVDRRQRSNQSKDDLLQYLLDVRYADTGEPMTRERLLEELLILVVAGHETTAQSLTWTISLLARHPHIIEQLTAEINQNGDHYMTYFSSESFLLASIQESMRLYPPSWLIDRQSIQADEVNGQVIEPDVTVLALTYLLHRDDRYWANPLSYDPSRFIDNPSPEAYIPFGAGPRYCIGSHFALLEMVIILYRLLTSYEIQPTSAPMPAILPLITLHPASQVELAIHRR